MIKPMGFSSSSPPMAMQTPTHFHYTQNHSFTLQHQLRKPFNSIRTTSPLSSSLCSSTSLYRFFLVKCLSQKQSTQQPPRPPKTEEEEVYGFERLFSNLNQATLKREPGSVTSAVFLVAGTTVGAGILAIPAVTQESGFLASSVACIICWIFMVGTGLLIAEVNIRTMCELGSGGVSLISMAQRTLGTAGVQVACWSYIFIHYALLVAYVSRSSDILANNLGIPLWESGALFSLSLGGICYFGSQRLIGAVNGALVFGIIISFATLVVFASGNLHWDALLKANFEAVPAGLPIIALSFVYQNVVPVLCTNLEGNPSKVRTAIVLGTAIPLFLFLVWNAVILGTINLDDGGEKIVDPLQQLRSSNGVVGPIVETFSLLAIATSYIGFVLGLTDFLADLLKLPIGENRPLPYLLTLFPPVGLALLNPEIFFKALDFAGTYGGVIPVGSPRYIPQAASLTRDPADKTCSGISRKQAICSINAFFVVMVLFGLLPAAMAWSDRYSTSSEPLALPSLVPGGKVTLSFVIGGASWVIASEILENFTHTQ